MKIYRIKRQFASILTDLKGLYKSPSDCWDYVDLHVLDNQALSNLGSRRRLTSLPKSCDSELINDIFEQIQFGKGTSASVKILREYLQCAEKKDKNNEIKSDIKEAFKDIFLGLLLIAAGGVVGCFALLLIGVLPHASWILLSLCIPIMAGMFAAFSGVIIALSGCLELGKTIFSFCFLQKNIEQLPVLEAALQSFFFLTSPPPPSYLEVMENNTVLPTPPMLYSEPPTYHQAIKNSAALSTSTVTPPVNIPALVLPYHSVHFFHHPHSVSSNQVVNDHRSPVCKHYFN